MSPIMLIDFHAFPSVALLLLLLSLIFHHKRRRNFAYSTQGRDLRARPFAIAFQIVTWPSLEKNPMPRPRERAERHAAGRRAVLRLQPLGAARAAEPRAGRSQAVRHLRPPQRALAGLRPRRVRVAADPAATRAVPACSSPAAPPPRLDGDQLLSLG